MELKQAPHEKLTEDEIKQIIEEVHQGNRDLHEKVENILCEYYELIDSRMTKLLKHTSPEQFKTISMKEMTNLMTEAYGDFKLPGPARTGSILKMRKDPIDGVSL